MAFGFNDKFSQSNFSGGIQSFSLYFLVLQILPTEACHKQNLLLNPDKSMPVLVHLLISKGRLYAVNVGLYLPIDRPRGAVSP